MRECDVEGKRFGVDWREEEGEWCVICGVRREVIILVWESYRFGMFRLHGWVDGYID